MDRGQARPPMLKVIPLIPFASMRFGDRDIRQRLPQALRCGGDGLVLIGLEVVEHRIDDGAALDPRLEGGGEGIPRPEHAVEGFPGCLQICLAG